VCLVSQLPGEASSILQYYSYYTLKYVVANTLLVLHCHTLSTNAPLLAVSSPLPLPLLSPDVRRVDLHTASTPSTTTAAAAAAAHILVRARGPSGLSQCAIILARCCRQGALAPSQRHLPAGPGRRRIASSSAFWAAVHSKYDAFLSHIVEGIVELKQLFPKPLCDSPVLLGNKRKEPARDHSVKPMLVVEPPKPIFHVGVFRVACCVCARHLVSVFFSFVLRAPGLIPLFPLSTPPPLLLLLLLLLLRGRMRQLMPTYTLFPSHGEISFIPKTIRPHRRRRFSLLSRSPSLSLSFSRSLSVSFSL
jgi:hypothetical protein